MFNEVFIGPVLRRLGIDIPSNKLYLSFLHAEILVDLLSQNPFFDNFSFIHRVVTKLT
jgi:hypothetical protein